MLKYFAKISMDILPSVLATIIGAYIVNHYINAKPAAEIPAAIVAPADAGKAGKPADMANHPAPGVKAKGIAEKNLTEKPAATKLADQPAAGPKAGEKAGDKVGEKTPEKTADVAPAEISPRGKPSAHEKAVAKSTPAVTAPAAAVVEANSAPASAAPAATPDPNDLVRAAIERLRKTPEGKSAEAKAAEAKAAEAKAAEAKAAEAKAAETKSAETRPSEKLPEPLLQEAVRAPEAQRVVTASPAALRPLPPPITVSTPQAEIYPNSPSSQASPAYTATVGNDDDPNRLTPPADIPVPVIAPPLDLRADAGASVPRPKTNVADDMLSGVKSMFHAVLPKSATPD